MSTGNIGWITRSERDKELGRAPSMANCLSTTVPVNLAASQIAGRHTPTRNSLRHSRMIVMHRTGNGELARLYCFGGSDRSTNPEALLERASIEYSFPRVILRPNGSAQLHFYPRNFLNAKRSSPALIIGRIAIVPLSVDLKSFQEIIDLKNLRLKPN